MKTIKVISVFIFGLLLFGIMGYLTISFIKGEMNPFLLSERCRGAMLFVPVTYLCFTPVVLMYLNENIE